MKFESKFGIGEIVIREHHKNGKMVGEDRMMEVIGVHFGKDTNGIVEAVYVCEDSSNGHRQMYAEHMLVGDPDFDQETGKYPQDVLEGETNAEQINN